MRILASLVLLLSIASHGQTQAPAVRPLPDAPPAPEVLHVGGDVLAPKLIFQADPDIPEAARKLHKSVHVQVYTHIGPDGTPSHLRLMQSANLGTEADQRILDAVRQYRYKPATLNGNPVTVELYVDIFMDIF